MFRSLYFVAAVLFFPSNNIDTNNLSESSSYYSIQTIQSRFAVPAGYARMPAENNSFANYLRNLSLHEKDYPVHYYNGKIKPYRVYEAVIKMDVGNTDLQQCADAIMRLRSEYLYANKRFSEISFTFTDGFKANYGKWREGYKIVSDSRGTRWVKTQEETNSYQSFREYLNMVFMYSGTLSLSKQLKSKNITDLQTGDLFIKGGSPGHAMLVVDVAVNKQGKKIFMLAQSYMPAQEIHIVKNYNDLMNSPWYSLNDTKKLQTPEWTFTLDQLKGW